MHNIYNKKKKYLAQFMLYQPSTCIDTLILMLLVRGWWKKLSTQDNYRLSTSDRPLVIYSNCLALGQVIGAEQLCTQYQVDVTWH